MVFVSYKPNSAIERGTKPDALGRKPCHWTNTLQAAMVTASRAWQYAQTRCMTFLPWQTKVSIDNTVSTRRRSCHSPRWQSLRFVGSLSASWKAVSLKTIMRSSHCRISHCKVFSATLAVAQRPGHHQPPLIEQQTPFPAD